MPYQRAVHSWHYRFFLRFRADLSIKKSLSFFPSLIAATIHRGLAPRPAQVSPEGPRYLGATFLPLNALTLRPLRPTLSPPDTAIALSILSNCFCISARCSRNISSTRVRRAISSSMFICERFAFAIVSLQKERQFALFANAKQRGGWFGT